MSDIPFDSATFSYQFVPLDRFTPNSHIGWTRFGDLTSAVYDAAPKGFVITGVPRTPTITMPA